MELTKKAISDNKDLINGLGGYSLIVSKIEGNVNINPDIAIESCRSLIEGLCLKSLSLFSAKYNSSKSFRGNCKQDLTLLTKTTFDEVYSNYVESQIHESLSSLLIDLSRINRIKEKAKNTVREQLTTSIGKIAAIRHERGDISHGRNYPKPIESSIILAKSIASICDGICSFMITEMVIQYKRKKVEDKKLPYEDLVDYNSWLNRTFNALATQIDFSKLLFQNAYEKYEEIFYGEYQDELEEEMDALKPVEIEISGDNPEKSESENILFDRKEINDEPIELTNKYSFSDFWTKTRVSQVSAFAAKENLKAEELPSLIENFIFTDKPPLRDEVADIMNEKPPLKERAKVIDALIIRTIELVENLKKLKE